MAEETSVVSKQMDFLFTFPLQTREDTSYKLKVPMEIPFTDSIAELVQRLVSSLKLPAYIEEGRLFSIHHNCSCSI